MTLAFDCFNEGRLADAVHAAVTAVRDAPSEIQHRWELTTLICFEGDLERAQKHVKVMLGQDKASDMVADLMMLNGLLKGEAARRQCFEQGRVPELPDAPGDEMALYLRALTILKSDPEQCDEILQKATPGSIAGECDGEAFSSFHDANPLTAGFFEAITLAGDYYWLPISTISRIDFSELSSPQEILWRYADLTTVDGDSVNAFLPALYPGTYRSNDDMLKLGRAADFSQEPPFLGLGGRMFVVDGEMKPMASLQSIRFESRRN